MRIMKIYKEILKLMKNQVPSFYFWYMSMQSSSNQIGIHFSNPDKSLQFRPIEVSESENLFLDHIHGEDKNVEDVQMADHLRPMEELLQIPIIGIAIVVPAVLANEFELKIELLDFISNNPFFGLENDDPHSHIKRFYQITRTFKINQVPHGVVKLILFPFSLKGAAETWLGNEPPCSITTWDDLVSKFLNRFYPHSKIRELKKEITNFQQVFGETFSEAWERFKDLLTKSGGNPMSKNTQEALTLIENKAKVRTFRNKPQVSSKGGTSTQIDVIAALTKQVEALGYHIASMQETYNRNQEVAIQLIQNQMGQMAEALQERPSCVPSSNTVTKPRVELKSITTVDGLTLDGSLIPHSNLLVFQEPETITGVVEIASSQSTPLAPPPETLPLSTPKPKENPKLNPRQPLISSRLQKDKFQALENPTGCADHFIYRIDIVDSLCDKFPIENNSLSDNPTPSDLVVASLSPSPTPCGDSDFLLEETDTLPSHSNISLHSYESFCFDIDHQEEKSSGSTTSQSDHSLPDYEAFCFEEKSSGNTTSHSDLSLLEYESLLKKNISDTSTKDLTINELNDFPLPLSDCDSTFSEEFFEIDLLVSFPSGNKDKIFDPEIFIIKGVQSQRFLILPLDDFSTISLVSDSLFLTDPSEIETFLSFPSENEDKVFNPGILIIDGVFSFTRKSPHLLSDNFMIDKCHILSEISLMTESSVSFLPKDKEIRGE
ncbi:reverse transcriptase domain-containing protein [Tanacetum coccineum]